MKVGDKSGRPVLLLSYHGEEYIREKLESI